METTNEVSMTKEKCWDQLYVFNATSDSPIEAELCNAESVANQYPEIFEIHSRELREIIPLTMLIKINVDWNDDFLFFDRFWVEVTNIANDRNGEVFYFGVIRNDTLVGDYGSAIGPIYPQHIYDLDAEDFIKKHKLTLAA